jgi:uncharacterized protein YbbC (DUF1343 family)
MYKLPYPTLLLVLLPVFVHLFCGAPKNNVSDASKRTVPVSVQAQRVVTGAERLDTLLPMLQKKRVACVVNQTSLCGTSHLVDTLLQSGVEIRRIFAPEHGFRGTAEAGATISNGRDARTNLPIVSLYGKNKKPQPKDLADIDVVIFDIQDVGARFYTYISTLFYLMEACAEEDKELIVLDRPNPNGHYVDGPILEPSYTSFVGIAPLPVVHGCTVGEISRIFEGEKWIKNLKGKLRLSIILCQHYTHQIPYDLPVAPSPNLPNMHAVLLYPAICLFEGTTASLGRGTPSPFQIVGHPKFPVKDFSFVPKSVSAATEPPQMGHLCFGYDYRNVPLDSLRAIRKLDLQPLLRFYQTFPKEEKFFLDNLFFDKLAGTASLRQQILASWEPSLSNFKKMRKKYLLYTD